MSKTGDALLKLARQNPDIAISGEALSVAVSNGSTGHVSIDTVAASNEMAARFEQLWALLDGPELEPEVRFHTTRRWRFDYCHLPTRTAIELEGGVYSQGRHTRGAGFVGDCEKYNEARHCGYSVFRLATGMITPAHIQPIIDYINRELSR